MNFTMAPTADELHSMRLESVQEIIRTMYYVWLTALLLLGSFGNVVTILVLQRSKTNNNPSSPQLMLQALAVADLLVLWSAGVEVWLLYCVEVNVRSTHSAVCKLYTWFIYSTSATSAWMVTAVTVQRTIAVRFPLRMRVLCTPRRTRVVIAVIVVANFCLQGHWLVLMEVVHDLCVYTSPEMDEFVWTWVDMVIASILPSLCQFVCDVLLGLALLQGSAALSAPVITISTPTRSTACRKMALRTTIMVLVLSTTFLLLTLPVCVGAVWYGLRWEYICSGPETIATYQLARAVTALLWFTNSAVNFLLYCATGGRFRREFLNLLKSGWARVTSCPSSQP